MPLLFTLRKLMTIALMPLSIAALLLLYGLIRKKRLPIFAALAVLYVSSIPFTGDRLVSLLENRYPRIEIDECPPADAVVVLGGLLRDSRGAVRTLEWAEAVDRFEKAVYLLRAGRAEHLVLSGGSMFWVEEGYTEGGAMRDVALSLGISDRNIHVVRNVATTADEAHATAALAKRKGWDRLILVTSAFHMPRSSLLFERQQVTVVHFPVDYQTARTKPLWILDFVPQADGLSKTELAVKEFYGLIYYTLIQRS